MPKDFECWNYHAMEHLGDFCLLFQKEQRGKQAYAKLSDMLREGDVFQVLEEMRCSRNDNVNNFIEIWKRNNIGAFPKEIIEELGHTHSVWGMKYKKAYNKQFHITNELIIEIEMYLYRLNPESRTSEMT